MMSFRGTYWLSSTYLILLRVLRFLYLFLVFYYYFFFCGLLPGAGIEVNLSIIKIKQWSCS